MGAGGRLPDTCLFLMQKKAHKNTGSTFGGMNFPFAETKLFL